MKTACIWLTRPSSSAGLAEIFLRFSPQICVIPDQAIFVEIGHSRNLFNEGDFLLNAATLLKEYHVQARICLGVDVTDSLVQAKHNCVSMDQAPLVAALDFVDPFGKDEALRKEVSHIIKCFKDLGITTIGQLKRMPLGDLIARFGLVGRFMHQRLNGTDFISWPRWKPEEIIRESKEFPFFEFYGELDPIIFELKNQLDLIFGRLFSRSKRLVKLEVEVVCEKNSAHPHFLRRFEFEFFAPQSEVKGTLKILRERLGREFEKAPILSPIEGLRSTVLKAIDFEGGQKNIFNNDEEKNEKIFSVHNQFAEILGKENVFQAELVQDRRPERSWKKRYDSPHQKTESDESFIHQLPTRLPILCDKPVQIDVAQDYVNINQRRYRVKEWKQPVEKILGGWGEHEQATLTDRYARLYFIVVLEDGRFLSIFQTLHDGWFLHGYSA